MHPYFTYVVGPKTRKLWMIFFSTREADVGLVVGLESGGKYNGPAPALTARDSASAKAMSTISSLCPIICFVVCGAARQRRCMRDLSTS
jgi:hypothetical protein